jgi:high-affinity iron transporter
LEAFLIIAVILAIIKNSGIKRALPWLHGGWIAAVFMGCLGWYLSGWILHISGKNREIMEGVVALFAVVVLTVVGFWLHNNSHARKWKVFIEERINKLLNKESMFSLAVFSFMVVFREAFETVLFLQAISLETPQENQLAIGMGVLSAFVIIAFLMILFIRFSKSIPVRQLFRYSAWMITLLAVILIGQGVHAIQESGIFSITEFPFNFRIEWAGIYPTFETMLSQSLLLAAILFLYHLQNRRLKLRT